MWCVSWVGINANCLPGQSGLLKPLPRLRPFAERVPVEEEQASGGLQLSGHLDPGTFPENDGLALGDGILVRAEVRHAELLRVVGFEYDGHRVWFLSVLGWCEDTKKPGRFRSRAFASVM